MVVSSRSSTVVPYLHHVDSTWQLVNVEELGRMEHKQHATAAQLPSIRHRRGQTEGKRRLSMLRIRSKGRTKSASSMCQGIPASESFDSLHHGDTEGAHPESGWSDSDHSDSLTKSWVLKGSKMLKKQNSKFSLSSSRRNTWVEESDDAGEQRPEPHLGAYGKHSRIRSAGSASPVRPNISQPYNFKHVAHTQPHQFADLHRPSPRAYRLPRSPGSPPVRSSSRNAVHAAPDFFSEVHHATPKEREILAQCTAPADVAGYGPPLPGSGSPHQSNMLDTDNVPHAITTSDDIALTLRPPMVRRSTLALADVPEEDELRSTQRVSSEPFRPVTADPILRHAMSFPSNDCSPRQKRVSSSQNSLRLSGGMPLERLHYQVSDDLPGDASNIRSRVSRHTSKDASGTDACWEDDIDYCYQLEAEADCDFDWDRVSQENTRNMDGPQHPNPSANPNRDSGESLSKTYEKLESPHEDDCARKAGVFYRSGSQHLPRLQTSLPDLDFSAASSAKSSTASLRGPMTPGQLFSPKKVKPVIQLSKSSDNLNLDPSFSAVHTWDQSCPQEDSLEKVPSWDHAMDFNYPFNNLSLSGGSTRSAPQKAGRPVLSIHRSSENVTCPTSSAVNTRRNTSSTGSFPELVCSQNYRQQVSVVAEQIADRIAALSVTDVPDTVALSHLHPSATKNTCLHSILKKDSTDCNNEAPYPRPETASGQECGPQENPTKQPGYLETSQNDLLSLQWPQPPQNILLVQKRNAPTTTQALKEFAQHIHDAYPNINVLLEPDTANELHRGIPFPVYTAGDARGASSRPNALAQKVDLTATFGGDGTILRASSLFSRAHNVPPILSFSMGTLGFLGEWKFAEFKRAFREVYMSGAGAGDRSSILESDRRPDGAAAQFEGIQSDASTAGGGPTGWSSIRGKSLGKTRGARVLLRNRLRVAVETSVHTSGAFKPLTMESPTIHAMNEIIIHRGATPHLAHIAIFIGGRFLTEAVADGMIISTPTGSTAYSLSSGGSIIHPLVESLCLTPICPRSLSFRPLVLPASTPVTLRLSEHNNRGREVEVSIDGVRQKEGLKVGGEIRVLGEEIQRDRKGWRGGVPCVMRGGGERGEDDGWVGGLNGLLKFNYPFGEEG
ncbi:MAG: hypothetical protein Q9184_002890 [Pyrenodesmia sp. 2 TL-2023]